MLAGACGPRWTSDDLDAIHRACSRAAPAPSRATPVGKYAGAPPGAPVTIYGAAWCEPCHVAEAYLTRRRIPFVTRDVEADPAAASAAVQALDRAGIGERRRGLPIIDVRGTVMIGFQACEVERAWSGS